MLILQINTATEQAAIALSEGGNILAKEENPSPKDHASWLHPAIQRLLASVNIPADRLKAVAVSAGPGSYTGLRVGMAAAKGICYALGIPLIAINTLQIMAESTVPLARLNKALICPMIDARRQEVFTALYNADMQEIIAPQAMILDKTSFEAYLFSERIIFSGSGSDKWRAIAPPGQSLFEAQLDVTEAFAKMATQYFSEKKWADTSYAEPIYLKEFYTHAKN